MVAVTLNRRSRAVEVVLHRRGRMVEVFFYQRNETVELGEAVEGDVIGAAKDGREVLLSIGGAISVGWGTKFF